MNHKNRHYSYFLVKPDGVKYLKDIEKKIIEKEFDRAIFLAVNDWEKIQKDLYEEHYKKEGFAQSYQAFIDAEKRLYGNRAIAILVASEKGSYQELMEKVYQTKLEIRDELAYKVGLVTMSNEPDENKANKILLSENQGKTLKRAKRFDREHTKYRLSHLDVIHCPDPQKDVTLNELEKLFKQGIIKDENIISTKLFKNIQKYKTSEFLQDQYENQVVTSNYTGHIADEIKENEMEI